MKIQRALTSFLLAIVFLVAGFLLGFGWRAGQATLPISAAGTETRQSAASVLVDTGYEILSFSDLAVGQDDTVLSILERAADRNQSLSVEWQDYGDLGTLVTSMNGYQNGTNDKYWQYWVNNRYADIAADRYQLSGGENIMWKFTSSRFSEY